MGRPRKDSNQPDARQSIVDAFWWLLQHERYENIVVKEIIAKAGCSRATFYYHFDSVRDLLEKAIVEDLIESGNIPRVVFAVLNSESPDVIMDQIAEAPAKRIALVARQGGLDLAQDILCERILQIWETVLCCSRSDLTPKTEALVRWEVYGVLGMVCGSGIERADFRMEDVVPVRFLTGVAPLLIQAICEEQKVDVEVVKSRLAMFTLPKAS